MNSPGKSASPPWRWVAVLAISVIGLIALEAGTPAEKVAHAGRILVLVASYIAVALPVGVCLGLILLVRKIRRGTRFPVEPVVRAYEGDDPDAPAGFAAAADSFANALTPLGYGPMTMMRVEWPTGPAFLAFLRDARTLTTARLGAAAAAGPDPIINFSTRMADGGGQLTRRSTPTQYAMDVSPRVQGLQELTFFDADPVRLARLHEAAVERRFTSRAPFESPDPVETIRTSLRRDAQARVAVGDWSRLGDAYRPTYKGILWILAARIPPISSLRVRAAQRRAEHFVRETGL